MISRVTPSIVIVQRYSAWVWADTITLIAGSSRAAISHDVAAGEVAGAAVQDGRAGLGAALVDHEHGGVDALALQVLDRLVGGVGLVEEGQTGDAGRA